MKLVVYVLAIAFLTSMATIAPAAVISRDWKTPGDGLLTYDTVNKREWLDLSLSLLFHYGSFDLVVAETLPGGDFDGFTPAKMADVVALAQSAGVDTGTLDIDTNGSTANALMDLLGTTVISASGRTTLGLIDEFLEDSTSPQDQLLASVGVQPPYQIAGLNFVPFSDISSDRFYLIMGVMLYRTVPEPTSIVLGVFFLMVAGKRTVRRSYE